MASSSSSLLCAHSSKRIASRNLLSGFVVSDKNGYYDSQNIVALCGGRVLHVVLHWTANREGGPGLALYKTRSTDGGMTWDDLEVFDKDAASEGRQTHDGYQLLLKRNEDEERLYVFYGCNVGERRGFGGEQLPRSDMQLEEGYYYRYSDDAGETWSKRFVIPVRRTAIDLANPWGGKVMGMFMCDKPVVVAGGRDVMFAFQKTRDGAGETHGSEVFFIRCVDFVSRQWKTQPEPKEWETLPLGERGMHAPSGTFSLGEEPHVFQVSNSSEKRLGCVWRAETGQIACAYSDDEGESWSAPGWLTYNGVPSLDDVDDAVRNPRGAITPHRFARPDEQGRAQFCLTIYNNSHTEKGGYVGRRVMWIIVGRECKIDGKYFVEWGQPEICLWYDGAKLDDREDWNEDWAIVDGPGYVDFTELDDRLVFVESNKLAVRFHQVNPRMLQLMRNQWQLSEHPQGGKLVDAAVPAGTLLQRKVRAPVLPDCRTGDGFSFSLWIRGGGKMPEPGHVIVDALQTVSGALDEETDATITKGFTIHVSQDQRIELFISNGFGVEFTLSTSGRASTPHRLWDGKWHHACFILDGASKVACVVVDGSFCDGGADLPQGWKHFPRAMGEIGGSDIVINALHPQSAVRFREYDRPLYVSEAIAMWRAKQT